MSYIEKGEAEMTCPQCRTDDLTNHLPDCGYHPDNFQTGEQQLISGLEARVKELLAALKPFADEITVTPEGRYSVRSDRRRSPVTDLMRARRAFDGAG